MAVVVNGEAAGGAACQQQRALIHSLSPTTTAQKKNRSCSSWTVQAFIAAGAAGAGDLI